MALIKSIAGGKRRSLKRLFESFLLNLQSSKPKEKPAKLTEMQLRFQQAVAFAKMVSRDPGWKKSYTKLVPDCRGFYHLALRDALSSPRLQELLLSPAVDCTGISFRVQALDNVGVVRVVFQFTNTNGQLLEEGRGQLTPNSNLWSYTTISSAPALVDSMATITAYDLAGNKAVIHKSL